MRLSHRLVTLFVGSLVAMPAAQAQEARLFENSWYWGVHAGSTSIGTAARSAAQVGSLGAEWVITRKRGGLYVAFDQANFTRPGEVTDASTSTGARTVNARDMRTFSIGGVAFPVQFGNIRPYAGLGFALSVIGSTQAQPDPVNEAGATQATLTNEVTNRIEEARSRGGVFLMGGAQWQVGRAALFGQISTIPGSDRFLVTNAITSVSFGIRYNVGSSIDR
jgi:hypothetical protein